VPHTHIHAAFGKKCVLPSHIPVRITQIPFRPPYVQTEICMQGRIRTNSHKVTLVLGQRSVAVDASTCTLTNYGFALR
jgi:hypothetical protein